MTMTQVLALAPAIAIHVQGATMSGWHGVFTAPAPGCLFLAAFAVAVEVKP
jgi:hypothetical protein